MDEVNEYLKYNTMEIREDVIEMVSGGEIEYFQKFRNENENILAVAICYDSKTKEHSCKIERI